MDLSPDREFDMPEHKVDPLTGILIDASTSEEGWSSYGSFRKCPHLYSMSKRYKLHNTAGPLVMGTMGHLLQAHHRAIQVMEDGEEVWIGTNVKDGLLFGHKTSANGSLKLCDPGVILSPTAALDAWCARNPAGYQYRSNMLSVFERWLRGPDKVGIGSTALAIETPITMELGTDKEGFRSLFIKYDDVAKDIGTEPEIEYEPILLNMPGHPKHGLPIRVTRRADLIVERRGAFVIVDHKHTSMVNVAMAEDEYAVDGGFQLFDAIGIRLWGSRAEKVQLNLIERRAPYSVEAPFVRRTGNVIDNMARRIYDIAHEKAALELQTMRGERLFDEWPDRVNETGPCKGKYGKCMLFEWCITGDHNAPLTDD